MAALVEIYFKKEVLETILNALKVKEQDGFSCTVSIKDEINQYGQNVSAFASQTKEQREKKKPHFFVANGKVVWTDGKIAKPEKIDTPALPTPAEQKFDSGSDQLPF